MTRAFEFGLPGVGLGPGDHVCAVYLGPAERDAILLPYLRAGLDADDKCICVVDPEDAAGVQGGLGDPTDVAGRVSAGQLEMTTPAASYFRTGRFLSDEMLAFWDDAFDDALGGGRFRFVRVVGEVTWSLDDDVVRNDYWGYESRLNDFGPRYPHALLCLYDLNRFGAGILVDILETHPKVLLGGMLLDNPHYLSPDQYRQARAAEG